MDNSGIIASHRKTEEIQRDQWIPFLAQFTRENRGAHARLEIIGPDSDIGYQVQTENRLFDGVSADLRQREDSIWIAFGTKPEDHITHAIQNASVVRVIAPGEHRGAVLEVEAADGTKSILELTRPGEYELPMGKR